MRHAAPTVLPKRLDSSASHMKIPSIPEKVKESSFTSTDFKPKNDSHGRCRPLRLRRPSHLSFSIYCRPLTSKCHFLLAIDRHPMPSASPVTHRCHSLPFPSAASNFRRTLSSVASVIIRPRSLLSPSSNAIHRVPPPPPAAASNSCNHLALASVVGFCRRSLASPLITVSLSRNIPTEPSSVAYCRRILSPAFVVLLCRRPMSSLVPFARCRIPLPSPAVSFIARHPLKYPSPVARCSLPLLSPSSVFGSLHRSCCCCRRYNAINSTSITILYCRPWPCGLEFDL